MAAKPVVPPADLRGYSFGPFVVDSVRRLLWRDAHVVPLSSKTFDLLTILLTNRDRIVGKEELLQLIWPDAVVQENNLVRQVSTLRKALGERPDQHEYVVTVSGQGYRFVGDVRELDELPKEALAASGSTTALTPDPAPDPAEAATDAVEPATPAPAGRPTTRSVPIVATGLFAAAAMVIAVVVMSGRPGQSSPPVRALHQFTYDQGLQQSPSWAPDGQSIVYASTRAGNSDIWVQSLGDPTPTQITSSPSADWQPAWSPDGRWIAFRSERDGGGLFVVPATGGSARRVASEGFQPMWAPDNHRLLFQRSMIEGLSQTPLTVDVSGGPVETVRPELSQRWRSVRAAWTPDGRISLLGRDGSGWTFLIAGLKSGDPVRVAMSEPVARQMSGLAIRRFAWLSSGSALILEAESERVRNLWRVSMNPRTYAWMSVERLTNGTGQDADVSISSDGQRLAFNVLTERTRLWSFALDDATGRVIEPGQPVSPGGSGEFDAAAPPDGSKVAYRTERAGRQELWEHSIESGGDRLLLASRDFRMTSPRWSRDGTRLAYQRMRGDSTDGQVERTVAILRSSGGPEAVLRMSSKMEVVPDDWSPDGAWIVGACRDASMPRMGTCLIPASAGDGLASVELIASDPARSLMSQRFSPNQQWISFMATGPAQDRKASVLYTMPLGGGAWTAITDGRSYDDKPRWSADGRLLYFISDRNGLLELWARRIDPATGQPLADAFRAASFEHLEQRLPPNLFRMEIAVSAKRVFLPITETTGKIWILDQIDK